MEAKSSKTRRSLPQKQFALRESLITDAIKNSNIKAVYNMAVASFIGYVIHNVVIDYNTDGDILKFWYVSAHLFRKLHLTTFLWITIYCVACMSYFAFKIWATIRTALLQNPKLGRLWDITAISALLTYYAVSYRLVRLASLWFDLPPLPSMIFIYEQTRLLMKVHSFVRYNAEKVIKFEAHKDKALKMQPFSHFVYFTFVPTLIYRDIYPRTKNIRWSFAIKCFLETVACTIYVILLCSSISSLFDEFGSRKFTRSELTVAVFKATIPGFMALLTLFYLLQHSSQNLFAEILTFGDRLFYKEWWNSSSFSDYFKTWNSIVHDWLFEYIYKDFVELILPDWRTMGKFMVFFISAVVHEIAMVNFLNSFFPVMFIEFLFIGAMLSVVNLYLGNILFLYLWSFGSGTLFCAYTIEYWARQNSPPPTTNSTMDFFIPRSLVCDCVV